MSESEMRRHSAGTSRRTLLKGAVGAGVGLAAWSAPKIGSIPAYALTNSTGVFDNVCYYFVWNANAGRWGRGQNSQSPGADTGYGDSISAGTTTRTIVWDNVFGPGNPLQITLTGNPETSASVSLDVANPGCVFEQVSASTYFNQPSNPPSNTGDIAGCLVGMNARAAGTVSFSGSTGTLSGFAGSGRSYVLFNINCD